MDLQLVSRNFLNPWNRYFKQSGRVRLHHRHWLSATDDGFDVFRVRPEDTNYQAIVR
jgi:hypothetical protein